MNLIHKLQAELAEANARIAAYEQSLADMRAYASSPKYTAGPCPCPAGPSCPHMHATDVISWTEAARVYADSQANAAYLNEVGPKPEARYDGWHCPDCGDRISVPWNDTTYGEKPMRAHWRETHRNTRQNTEETDS